MASRSQTSKRKGQPKSQAADKPSRFVLRSVDTVGYPDALEDEEFLQACFVDGGYLDILRNTSRPERVVLGRTGAGKSALLERLFDDQDTRARRFLPETLALPYVTASPILTALDELGVNLDLFFNLLWKHVFAVELIRWRFDISDERTQRTLVDNVISAFNPPLRKAFQYLERYSSDFWKDSGERVLRFTQDFEKNILAGIDKKVFVGEMPSIERVREVARANPDAFRSSAQAIVEDVQRLYLEEIVNLIKEVLGDEKRKWYIVIDKLDENWVDDRFKAKLIRALLDTIRSFGPVRNLKIVVALRYDLIDRVFRVAAGSGAQREKYQGQFLHVRWSRPQLTEMLDRRIAKMVASRYSKSEVVTHRDIFPARMGGKQSTMDWLLDRTLMRPRDVIAYVNLALRNADGQAVIPANVLRSIEGEYSRGRLDAIFAEWDIDYPNLRLFVDLLKNRPSHCTVRDVTDEEIMCLADALLRGTQSPMNHEDLLSLALKAFDFTLDGAQFRQIYFWVFYQVGIVGIKLSNQDRYVFSHEGEESVSKSEITDASRASVHPCFARALAVGKMDPLDATRI